MTGVIGFWIYQSLLYLIISGHGSMKIKIDNTSNNNSNKTTTHWNLLIAADPTTISQLAGEGFEKSLESNWHPLKSRIDRLQVISDSMRLSEGMLLTEI